MTSPLQVDSVAKVASVTNHIQSVTKADVYVANLLITVETDNIVMQCTKPFLGWIGWSILDQSKLNFVIA